MSTLASLRIMKKLIVFQGYTHTPSVWLHVASICSELPHITVSVFTSVTLSGWKLHFEGRFYTCYESNLQASGEEQYRWEILQLWLNSEGCLYSSNMGKCKQEFSQWYHCTCAIPGRLHIINQLEATLHPHTKCVIIYGFTLLFSVHINSKHNSLIIYLALICTELPHMTVSVFPSVTLSGQKQNLRVVLYSS